MIIHPPNILALFSVFFLDTFFALCKTFLVMARLNLLQARYVGALGQTVGTGYKGRYVIKQRVDGKAVPSVSQVEAFSAFGCLNRLAGAISRRFWFYCGFSDRHWLRHNVIASKLQAAIAARSFNPMALTTAFPSLPLFSLAQFIRSADHHFCYLYSTCTVPIPEVNDYKICVVIFDRRGTVFYCREHDLFNGPLNLYADTWGNLPLFCFVLIAHKTAGKFSLLTSYIRQAAGMRYTLDEQMTDDQWLDGKPIYRRSFNIQWGTMAAGGATSQNVPVSGVDRILRAEYVMTSLADTLTYSADEIPTTNTTYLSVFNTYVTVSTGTVTVACICQNATIAARLSNQSLSLTLLYTKRT